MNKINPNIFISAGETSGDLLGADLALALQKKIPYVQLTGMGGIHMKEAGVHIQFDANRLAVVGLIEILVHLPAIFLTLRSIKRYLSLQKPDLIILIDFPDTHIRISKMAKKLGIPVLYYVSPQIWAWRFYRINQLKKTIQHMAVLFPFEEKFYQKEKIPVTVVGHSLIHSTKPNMIEQEIYAFFNLNKKKQLVALLPGSRQSEIKRHLPILIETAKKIRQEIPEIQFVLPIAMHCNADEIRSQLPDFIIVTQQHLYDLLKITDAAVAVSGTITLQLAFLQIPFCIIYRLNPLTYWIIKQLITIRQIGLCNIVAEQMIVKEFIQQQASANNIAAEILALLTNTQYHNQIKQNLSIVKQKLGDGNPSEKVAAIALQLLRSSDI